MASWRPKSALEEDVVSLQPECNFIYGNLADNEKQLQNNRRLRPSCRLEYLNGTTVDEDAHGSHSQAIRAVQRMARAVPFGAPYNEDPNDTENLADETVAMIRNCGMGPTVDYIDEKTTIPTYPISKETRWVRKSGAKFPVLLGDDEFKIETTRMRTRKIYDNIAIDFVTKELKKMELDQERTSPISILNEIDVQEPTETEMAANEYQEFITTYPELGKAKHKVCSKNKLPNMKDDLSSSKKTSMTKKKMHRIAKNSISPPRENSSGDRNESNGSSSPSLNSSISSQSVYNSFETQNSSGISTYLSANESLNNGCKTRSTLKSASYANVVQTNGNKVVEDNKQKQYYTPKQIYDMKRKA